MSLWNNQQSMQSNICWSCRRPHYMCGCAGQINAYEQYSRYISEQVQQANKMLPQIFHLENQVSIEKTSKLDESKKPNKLLLLLR
jgi:hypothetical protein